MAYSSRPSAAAYLDLRNLRNRNWKPAKAAIGIEVFGRTYELMHSFATFSLHALGCRTTDTE